MTMNNDKDLTIRTIQGFDVLLERYLIILIYEANA